VELVMTKRILLKGGLVATLQGRDGDGIRADVLVEDQLIKAVEPNLQVSDAEVLAATDMLVMPGFVDTHRHTWQTVFRGIASDWSLAQYAKGMHGTLKPHFTPADVHIANLLGRVEALHSGITTMLDWSHGITSPDHADAAVFGLRDAPGRSIFAYGGGFGVPCNDSIVMELKRLRTTLLPSNDDLLTMALGLRGPQYSSMEVTDCDVRLARELNLRVTVHGGSAGWGRNRPIARMFERGLLDDRTTVVHCNTLADDEIRLMCDCGCTASISPDAEIQMGFGWPATGRLLACGIRPSLSIDDCAAVSGDMFKTMHTALIAQRGLDNQAIANAPDQTHLRLKCRDVVEFATVEGARACGLSGRIGTLEPGKDADIIMVRLDDPTIFPVNHPLGALISCGHPGLVDTVLVAGKIVKRGGVMQGIDLNRLRQLARDSREGILERANADPAQQTPIRTGGRWSPSVEGYTASEVLQRNPHN
jgi:cytosine/adenosine deaminase-related metal-dependent hydrolase